MNNKKIITQATVTGLLVSSMTAFAAPDAIVIEQNSSQVTETLQKQSNLSFVPIEGSIIPVGKRYAPFQLPNFDSSEQRNWSDHIGQPVRVEHKQRDLSLEGTLESVSERSFTLSVKRVAASYPISDFYLVPKLAAANSRTYLNYQGQLTYQTMELSWRPELSLVIDDQKLTLIQQASVQNHSSTDLALEHALLHYSQNNAVRPMLKTAMTASARMEQAPATNYENSEITLELEDLTLPAASDTLVDLGKSTTHIKQSNNVATVYSHASSSKLPLKFTQEVTFASPKDLIPGSYQTLWHKDPYYIQGNRVALENTREGADVTVQLNRSLDLTGELSLVAQSQEKNSTTQTWELSLKNLSRQPQDYKIIHQLYGPIREVSLRSLVQDTANRVSLEGSLAANSTYQIRYTVEIERP